MSGQKIAGAQFGFQSDGVCMHDAISAAGADALYICRQIVYKQMGGSGQSCQRLDLPVDFGMGLERPNVLRIKACQGRMETSIIVIALTKTPLAF